MSTNKTQNYALHAWDLQDELPLAEFNENFARLDTALKAEETARDNGLAGKVEMVTGSYVGDDAEERTIALGFTPKAVYLCTSGGWTGFANGSIMTFGGLVFPGRPVYSGPSTVVQELAGTGLKVYHYNSNVSANSKHYTYYYVALR